MEDTELIAALIGLIGVLHVITNHRINKLGKRIDNLGERMVAALKEHTDYRVDRTEDRIERTEDLVVRTDTRERVARLEAKVPTASPEVHPAPSPVASSR